jgi:hypothetical protein
MVPRSGTKSWLWYMPHGHDNYSSCFEDPDMERIPEAFADAIHDAMNALQVAVLLAVEIDRGAQHSMSGSLDPEQAALRRAINRAAAALATLKRAGPADR